MAQHKFKGLDDSQEVDVRQLRPDTRRWTKRTSDLFKTTDGVIIAMMAVPFAALMLVKVPFSAEILLLVMLLFYRLYVYPGRSDPKGKGKVVKYDFPFRVPLFARRFDGSMSGDRLGTGITFLGKEISTKLEVWSGDSDLRTHMLCLGTTGSGKTEFLLGLVYNALVQNSGFLYTDGKGAVDLFNNVFRLSRYIGREDDLVTINFLTSGRDFLDKQKDRTTNTMNPFALGSSGMLVELIIGLMDDSGGGGDMWKGRAIAFVGGLTKTLCFLRDRGYLLLDAGKFIEYFELPVIEKLVWDRKITEGGHEITIDDPIFESVTLALRTFILTLPGYSRENKGKQEQKTTEQHGFITMQLTRLFGDLSYNYGHIFQTTLGEVDMYDVVINRRILVVLLPSLERAPDSLKMLGKLIVGAVKQMMAGCLGNRLEGSVREIVMARPTNAKVPFYCVMDEYGYYAVVGFAVAPAQARSLGFPQPLYSQVRMSDFSVKTMGDVVIGDMVLLPDGRSAPVIEVLEQGALPISRVQLSSGETVDAAHVHHWPARVGGVQTRLLTTGEIAQLLVRDQFVELSRVVNGKLEWIAIDSVSSAGVEQTRCLVVGDPLHCYLTDHGLVTHNCITFAAQDFSSLQKASKEEADATWENTNVRIAGRMTGGKGAETFKRLADVTGSAAVLEISKRDHESGFIEGYRTVRDTTVTKAERLEFGDLASQENGEFTILIGKKTKDGSGGVRIIRARTFYTQVEEAPREIRVNHFIKVEPPRTGKNEHEVEVIDALEAHFRKMLVNGDIKKIFPNDPLDLVKNKSNKPTPFLLLATYMRELTSRQKLSLGESIRAAMVCLDREIEIMNAREMQRQMQILEETKRKNGQDEQDDVLSDSVSVILDADVAPESAASAKEQSTESEFEVSIPDDFELSATPDGMPQGVVVSFDDIEDEDKKDDGEEGAKSGDATDAAGEEEDKSGDDKKTGSGSGTGSATDLRLTMPVEHAVAPEPEKALFDGIAIRNFLDDVDEEDVSGEDAASMSGDSSANKISPLTFRSLGEGDDFFMSPDTKESSYIEDRLVETELMLGVKSDILEIKNDAHETVKKLENITSYVNGATPEPATFEGVDSSIKALLYAAENRSNDFR